MPEATESQRNDHVSIGLAAAIRIVLVLLFLPFSALDKILNFRGAVAQAREVAPNATIATGLICSVYPSKYSCRSASSRASRTGLRLRSGRLLRRDRSALEAILEARRFLELNTGRAERCFGIS